MGCAMTGEREPFAVIVAPGLWRGFDVAVEPPTTAHPMRHFRDHMEALSVAMAIGTAEGWPVHDRVEADQ